MTQNSTPPPSSRRTVVQRFQKPSA